MNHDMSEKPGSTMEIEAQPGSNVTPTHDINEKVGYDRSGAIDAERIENNMTVLEAVKAYPAASWWAFVMSCTIVCPDPSSADEYHLLMPCYRSWNPTASSSWANS
jgi:SP family general alpha glucoside:H+ symporter-like MFS transporter